MRSEHCCRNLLRSWTFGFFSAVDVMAKELLNLRADAEASGASGVATVCIQSPQFTDTHTHTHNAGSYFVVESMGRQAGWLAYGTAVAGEAHMVVSVEDVVGELADSDGKCVDGVCACVARHCCRCRAVH